MYMMEEVTTLNWCHNSNCQQISDVYTYNTTSIPENLVNLRRVGRGYHTPLVCNYNK